MSSPYQFTRRRFIKTVAIGTGGLAIAGGLTGCAPASFLHGVASGDPLQDRVVIWTRVSPSDTQASVPVSWVVATDDLCENVIGSGTEFTDASRDFTVKLDVTGLNPDTVYYYQFLTSSDVSPIGRMRTLPADTVATFNMAVVCCANYPAGYFHVYREVAKRDDIAVVLHLGDYIYEYGVDGYASQDAAALGRTSVPPNELITLSDYRQRYAQYHGDTSLQAAHRRHSFICVWDDHEFADNAWRDGALNHNPGEGDWEVRKANAIQAYYEWVPVREPEDGDRGRLYRRFQVGNLLDLYMLDTRIIGRDKQLDYANYIDPVSQAFNNVQFQADLTDPNRTLLGAEQMLWLQQNMAASTATWQVLGQQVMIGRMPVPAPLAASQISFDAYAQILQQAQTDPSGLTPEQQAVLAAPSVPYDLDAWDGYFAARESVFDTARTTDSNLVVLSGDSHNAWANNLKTVDGTEVGVEFAVSSVSSPGAEALVGNLNPALLAGVVTQLITDLKYTNLQYRGYMVVNFAPHACRADWHYIDTVKSTSYRELFAYGCSLQTLPGSTNRTLEPVL